MLYILSKRCALCGKKFNSPDEATLDHIIPKARGGKNHWSNYQLAHKQCNRNKGSKIMPISDFLEADTAGTDLPTECPEASNE